jgi:hypothetical protein
MQTSRRNFLQTTAAVAAFVVAGGGYRAFGQERSDDLFRVPAEVFSESLYSMTMRQAEALLGTTFTTTLSEVETVLGGRSVRLTLTQVNSLERKANSILGCYGESFSLIFEAQQRVALEQGIYRMSGGGLVLGSVLLVPTGITRDKYEIIINHVTR